jgi:hypothetical protein
MREGRGVELNITLDHSHVVFKMDNANEQKALNTNKKTPQVNLSLAPLCDT